MPDTSFVDRLDSHVHFWRYDAQEYPWIDPADTVLRSDWLPAGLKPALEACGVSGVVAVQARATERDNAWLLELAGQNPWIRAVVGWVDFEDPQALDAVDRWCATPVFRGFRPMLQDCADPRAVCQGSVFSGNVQGLQARGLVFELLLRAPQLGCAPAFCAQHPHGPIILDHLGKPAVESPHASDAFWAWRDVMAELAAMPHVFVKLSGLMTEWVHPIERRADHAWQRLFWPYLDTALSLFGPQRLMFGSDWPVSRTVAPYETAFRLVDGWAATRLSESEIGWVRGQTAAHVYGLAAP